MIRSAINLLILAALLLCGWPARAHGDLHERIVTLTDQLNAAPSNAVLFLERADLRRQHGEFTAALADADQALRLRPDWAAAQLQRARVLFDLEKFAAAMEAADASLKLAAENPDARVIRARCLVQFGQTNEAIAELTHVLEQPARTLPDLYLERARWQADAGDPAAAVKGLDEGIRKLGNTPSLALPALEYERQQGAYAAALKRLDTVRTFLPPASLAALRGEILLAAGRNDEASAAFLDGLALLDNNSQLTRRTAEQSAALRSQLQAGLKQSAGQKRQLPDTESK